MNRKTITFFATIFFALTLTLSYAATKTQDGLQVELTTDKSSYSSSDTISVTVKVTNTGTTAVSDLTLENTIPMGYTKTTNTSSTKKVSILSAGDEATLTTSFAKERSASDTTSGNGNATGNTSGGMGSGSSASDVGDDNGEGTSANEGDNDESGAISQNENAYEDETVAGVEGSDIDGSSTGDGGVSTVAIAVGVIVVVGIAVAIVKIKSGKKLLSILICVSMVSGFEGEMMLTVKAAEYKTIEVSEDLKIGSETVKVVGSVKYQVVDGEEELGEPLPMPENATESEEFLWKYFDIIEIQDVSSSKTVQSESEVIDMLKERGFSDISIKYQWSMNGEYQAETEAIHGLDKQHPEYDATYEDKRNHTWILYMVNGDLYAYLFSYSLENPYASRIIVSESTTITEYLDTTSKYYKIVPHSDYAIVKKVNKIDAETLDSITIKELLEP